MSPGTLIGILISAAETIAAVLRETYCLFNNMSMWEDALRFKDLLGEKTEQRKRVQ